MPDGASLSDSTEDEEEGASLGDGSGAEGGSCSSSRRSGGDGGDEAEGSGVGVGEGETVQQFPLARPKSLMQKLQCSFQTSWLKDFPWLRYSKDTGLMSCGWCQKTPEDGGSGDQIGRASCRESRARRAFARDSQLQENPPSEAPRLYRAQTPRSQRPDIAAVQGFSVILDFLYSGNLVLTSQNAIEVMTVASYLQMSEVVQTCRNFIKDALNISIKSEAPESVVVDYNNRKPVNRDGLSSSRDQKTASFWATRNLTNLASNVKIENDGCNVDEGQMENYQMNDSSWVQDGSPELAENETQDCSVMQPPVTYPEEDLSFIKEEPDLDGALLSGPDCDRNVNANLLAEAGSGQDGGDADKSQQGGQESVDQGQDTDFPRDEEFEENGGEADEELVDDGEDQNDASRWDESGDVCMSLDD
ncbi:hypothetical protein CB1_002519008 [Camelus ferus]|nr:hypothetical protein CB1_002519008 [Camelus ferus]